MTELRDEQVREIDQAIRETYPSLAPIKTYGQYRIAVHTNTGLFRIVDKNGQLKPGEFRSVTDASSGCEKERKKATGRKDLEIEILAYSSGGVGINGHDRSRWGYRHDGENERPILRTGLKLLGVSAADGHLRVQKADGKKASLDCNVWLIPAGHTQVRILMALVKQLEKLREQARGSEAEIEQLMRDHGCKFEHRYGNREPEQIVEVEEELRKSLMK